MIKVMMLLENVGRYKTDDSVGKSMSALAEDLSQTSSPHTVTHHYLSITLASKEPRSSHVLGQRSLLLYIHNEDKHSHT